MCYTANDSLLAYVINFITSLMIFIYSSDEHLKVLSLFLMFVGQMQIFDYIFWKNDYKNEELDTNYSCNQINKITTKLAIIFNHLQPIILILLQYIYNFELSLVSIITIIIYSVVGISYTFNAIKKVQCTFPNKGVMDWKWNKQDFSGIYYFIFLMSLSISSFNFKNIKVQYASVLVNLISFFVATKTPILNYSIGRIWCYYASLLPLFLLIFI